MYVRLPVLQGLASNARVDNKKAMAQRGLAHHLRFFRQASVLLSERVETEAVARARVGPLSKRKLVLEIRPLQRLLAHPTVGRNQRWISFLLGLLRSIQHQLDELGTPIGRALFQL